MANIREPSSLLRMSTACTEKRDIPEDMVSVFRRDVGVLA